jgi:hypothetical protein
MIISDAGLIKMAYLNTIERDEKECEEFRI